MPKTIQSLHYKKSDSEVAIIINGFQSEAEKRGIVNEIRQLIRNHNRAVAILGGPLEYKIKYE